MSESWDEYAEGWDGNESAMLYSEKAFESLAKVVQPDGLRVLDFGCGTGLLTEKLSTFADQIIALDTSPKMVDALDRKKLPNVTTVTEPLSGSSVRENALLHCKFDLITASSVCSFLPDYESTLLLLKSLLAPGGLFVQWDWLSSDGNPDFGFSKKRVDDALKKAGFSSVALTQPFCLPSSEGNMPVLMAVASNT